MTKNTVEPWNDERVIAEAETIAASYVTLDDDQRRILRSEIIGVLRRQAIAEGQHCESRVEARQAQIERLRAQLAELEQWEDVEPYHGISTKTEEGVEARLFVDGDSNVCVTYVPTGQLMMCLPGDKFRIQRRKEGNDES